MNYDGHIAKWNGKHITQYGGQCVANASKYCIDNGKPIAYANAKDWWNHTALRGAFTFVTNNPRDFKQVPARGNIIIWNGGLAGSGGYGHIAIFDRAVSPGIFSSFDANWGGRQCHFVTHNWNNIIGWMVPKAAPAPSPVPRPQGGIEMIADQNQARLAYRLLRGDDPVTQGEIDGTAGKRSWVEFATTGKPELDARIRAKAETQKRLQELQTAINSQNQIITKLTTSESTTKAQYQTAVVQLAELNAQLTTAHDQIKDLGAQQTQDTQLLNEGKPLFNWLTKLIARLKG